MLALAQTGQGAMVVQFTGTVTSVQSSGDINAIGPYIATGDTFSGTFAYNPNAAGTPETVINNVGAGRQYVPGVTDFSLTFRTGNSTGHSINGLHADTAKSSMTVRDNIRFSSVGPEIIDQTSAVIWHSTTEFRPGLTQRNFVYRFQDFDGADMVDSASLAAWDADQVFANFETQFNELAFNSTATNFAQIANFRFDTFAAVLTTHVVDAGEPQFELLGGGSGSLVIVLPPTSTGVFSADFNQAPISQVVTSGISGSSAVDFFIPGNTFQYWNLDFTGDLGTTGATITFTYDESLLLPGTNESLLAIYHFENGDWVLQNGVVDALNNTITVSGLTSFSPVGLGALQAVATPEPASLLAWSGFGLVGLIVRAARRRRK